MNPFLPTLLGLGLTAQIVAASPEGCMVLPNATNVVQFRIYTNASPDAAQLFNTVEIQAAGERLLQSPGALDFKNWLATVASDDSMHAVLINGKGPELGGTNGMTLIECASGPEWSLVSLDATRAYGSHVNQYRRDVLFVEPDLFVVHDHVVAKDRVSFQMLLHVPAAMRLDPVWHDLNLEFPKASLRINAPSRRELRAWERVESSADSFLTNTSTYKVGPTNTVSQLDLITVFAVRPEGKKGDYVFKLVESNNAVGARIHRSGYPTLVGFRLGGTNDASGLDGFKFTGTVGVSVFHPRK